MPTTTGGPRTTARPQLRWREGVTTVPEAQLVPINARFDEDFVTQLVLVTTADTMTEVAEKVAYHVVGRRIAPRDAAMVVTYQGKTLPPDVTVADAGIAPLQNVYVNWADTVTTSGGG
jgi:toluene monooxygenase system protein B